MIRRMIHTLLMCSLMVVLAAPDAQAVKRKSRKKGRKTTDPGAEFIAKGQWNKGSGYYAQAIIDACADKKSPSFKTISRHHFGYLVCRSFPRMAGNAWSDSDRKAFERWLVKNSSFTQTFLLALNPGDDVPRAFGIVRALRKSSGSKTRKYQNLAVAFAVVWDNTGEPEAKIVESFKFLTQSGTKRRFKLTTMPPEMLKYVVDASHPLPERQWALKRFGSVSDMKRVYEMPEYDTAVFLEGKEAKIDKHKLTLQNIQKYGGVCHHRAIFASEVGKAQGLPCVYIRGLASSGGGHAWIGYLRRRGKGYVWDRDSGRIGGEDITFGRIVDPQTGRYVSEHELELALRAMRLPASKRREARTWLQVAQLLADAGMAEEAGRAMERSRKIGVFDKWQWLTHAKLVRKGVFTSKEVRKDMDDFTEALDEYPNLAVEAFEALFNAMKKGEPKDDLRLFDKMAKRFPRNVGAVGRIRLLQGRYLEALGRAREAERVYAEAVPEGIKCKAIGLDLLDNAARLMLKRNAMKDTVALHKDAYHKTKSLTNHAFVMYTSRFAVGLRQAKVNALARNQKAHDSILRRICSKLKGSSQERQQLFERLKGRTYDQVNTSRRPTGA